MRGDYSPNIFQFVINKLSIKCDVWLAGSDWVAYVIVKLPKLGCKTSKSGRKEALRQVLEKYIVWCCQLILKHRLDI